MNVVVIAPHPDDEAIGCGGAVSVHVANGDRVVAVFLTSGEQGLKTMSKETAWAIREREAQAAGRILGLSEIVFFRLPDWLVGDHLAKAASLLKPLLQSECPEMIYLPHENDQHPDHQTCIRIVKRALSFESTQTMPKLRCYEVWTPLQLPEQVLDISAVMPRKLRALRAHRSQMDGFDYIAAVKGLNQYRGALNGRCRYAEVFEDVEP